MCYVLQIKRKTLKQSYEKAEMVSEAQLAPGKRKKAVKSKKQQVQFTSSGRQCKPSKKLAAALPSSQSTQSTKQRSPSTHDHEPVEFDSISSSSDDEEVQVDYSAVDMIPETQDPAILGVQFDGYSESDGGDDDYHVDEEEDEDDDVDEDEDEAEDEDDVDEE